eukprot:3252042-Amphidinium_carterae.1
MRGQWRWMTPSSTIAGWCCHRADATTIQTIQQQLIAQFQATKTLMETMFIDTIECTICRSMPSIWQSTQGGTLWPMTPTMVRPNSPFWRKTMPQILTEACKELNSWCGANKANDTFWLDHSIATRRTTATKWHTNTYSAITMLNTRGMAIAFRQ